MLMRPWVRQEGERGRFYRMFPDLMHMDSRCVSIYLTRCTLYQSRYRTKFTPEQKERMKEFAERLGWRIQRHDDGALDRFCLEIGVDRHVMKVWMHNHKNQMSPAGGGGSSNGGMGVETVSLPGGSSAGAPVEAAAIRV